MSAELPPLPDDPIVEEIRATVARLDLPRRYRELDRQPAFPRAEFRALGEAHLLGLRTAPALGGRGLPLPRVGIALFHLAYGGGTVFAKLSLQPEFSSVLAEHGSAELVDAWFRPMLRGERLVGNHITEPGAGSDVAGIQSTATLGSGEYVLNGTKSEAAFAADADAAIVYAKVPSPDPRGGITAFLVPQDRPGVRRSAGEGDLGERWQRRGTVVYTDVRIPEGDRIGSEGKGLEYLRGELRRERALLGAIYLGVARASWDETVRYVGERTTFGKPLATQEAVAFPLVEDEASLSAAWGYVDHALHRLEAGATTEAEAALAKWMATETALRAIDHAIQFHGGRGYSQSLPHEQRWRDVRSGRIAHGPSEIMLRVAARERWPLRPS
ncbi:MAG: acyl-CoA dehydrogenase family protein [Thermoplasmata archaeon]